MSSFAPSAAKLLDNGFAYVTKAKKKRKGNAKRLVPGPRLDFQAELELTRQEFQSSEEWAGFREFIGGITQELANCRPSRRALCLGLGSPSASIDSMWQLVLLLDLLKHFGMDLSAVEMYDPLFAEPDVSQLKSLELSVLSENLGGRHTIKEGTLLYLPHCPMALLERLLRTNWSREEVETLVLVGNDVGGWIEGRRSHQTQYPCIERIAPFISSTPFPPDSFRVSETAFAGMSFQFVNFDISPPTFPESADLQLGRFSPSRKKKQRHTKNAWTPRPVLLPTDDKFWNLPEEDSSLAQDLEVL